MNTYTPKLASRLILSIFFLTIVNMTFAQKAPSIPYEWFEEKSKTISDLQQKVTGLKNDNGVELSFDKDNFTVFYNDKLASYFIITKNDGIDGVAIVEDIDFSKATGLLNYNNRIYVLFPENSLTLQVYGDDESKTVKSSALDFYTNSEADRKKMFYELYDLIARLQLDKGMITESQGKEYWSAYKSSTPYDFYKKYPKSILAYEGRWLEEDYERQIRFANEFVGRYPCPKLRTYDSRYVKRYDVSKIPAMSIKDRIKYQANFVSRVRVEGEWVYGLYYTILVSKNYNEVKQKYEEIASELTKNLDAGFLSRSDKPDGYFLSQTDINFDEGTGIIGKKLYNEYVGIISVRFVQVTYKREVWYELYVFFG